MLISLGCHSAMRQELNTLEGIYCDLGANVIRSESKTPDEVFHRDVFAWTPFGLIKCRMGKKSREREPYDWFKYRENSVFRVSHPGTFEGADLLWLEPTYALIGIGRRTNLDGYYQVSGWLGQNGVHVDPVVLPSYHDQHLLGVMNIARFDSGYRLYAVGGLQDAYELPFHEYAQKCSNWVQIDNNVIINSGAKETIRILTKVFGLNVTPVDIPNILNHGGGVACVTGIINPTHNGVCHGTKIERTA